MRQIIRTLGGGLYGKKSMKFRRDADLVDESDEAMDDAKIKGVFSAVNTTVQYSKH